MVVVITLYKQISHSALNLTPVKHCNIQTLHPHLLPFYGKVEPEPKRCCSKAKTALETFPLRFRANVSYPGTYISPGRISRRDFFLFSQIFYKDELGPIKICFIYSWSGLYWRTKRLDIRLLSSGRNRRLGDLMNQEVRTCGVVFDLVCSVFCSHASNSNDITRLFTCESPVFGSGELPFHWSSHCGHKTTERDELL